MTWITEFIWSLLKVLIYVALGSGWLYVMYQQMIKLWYPVVIIILRNAGGGADNRSAALHPKIFLRGKIKKTDMGDRMFINGIKGSVDMAFFSRERAHPHRGGIAYIIYEKEFNQFFPTKLKVISDNKEHGKKVKDAYEQFITENPDLSPYIMLDYSGKKQYEPVAFANTTIKLEPFPLDAITPYTYNVKERNARIVKGSFLDKYMPIIGITMVALVFIVAMVLFFDWSADRMDAIANNMNHAADTWAEQIVAKSTETAPGGSAGIFLPFLFRKKKTRVVV